MDPRAGPSAEVEQTATFPHPAAFGAPGVRGEPEDGSEEGEGRLGRRASKVRSIPSRLTDLMCNAIPAPQKRRPDPEPGAARAFVVHDWP
jgi:hypothetical protein